MNDSNIRYDGKTAELLKLSDALINRSRMLIDAGDIQSKTVEILKAESERLILHIRELTKKLGEKNHH